MKLVSDYWSNRYSSDEGIEHHAKQNAQIAKDFMVAIRENSLFSQALMAPKIVEVGCGTGELSALISDRFGTQVIYGTDFSRNAVMAAQKRHPTVNYWVFDIIRDQPFGKFDLAISSNTIEHFSEPYLVVDNLLRLAPLVILLIPYRQPVKDGYDGEGGAGHVFEFSKQTFKRYRVIDSLTFKTAGWQHASGKETPLQLAVLLRAREA